MEITIKIDEQSRSIFEGIYTELRKLNTANAIQPKQEAPQTVEAPEPVIEPAEAVAPVVEAKKYTQDDVRAKVMEKSAKGPDIKAKVKELLNEYAPSVPKLSPDNYAEFMARLEEI